MATSVSWKNFGRAFTLGAVLVCGGMLAWAQNRNPPKRVPDSELPAAAPGDTVDRPAENPRPARPAAVDPAPARGPAAPPRRPADEAAPRDAADPAAPDRDGERRPGLGIQFDAQAEGGLTVGQIEEESLAAQSGLRTGDRIVSVDGRAIGNQRQFQAYVSGQYGRRVPVIIERDGRQYTVQLNMQRPSADGAWLGVYLNDQAEDQTGASITQVYPAGPAARAGLRPGDVVLQLNGKQVAGTPELIATVDALQPRSQVELLVRRGEREITIPVMLGSRDSFVFYEENDDGGEGFGGEDDEFSRIPPYAMQLEHDRRMAEQHQRIEMELRKLQEEVRKLREALQPRN